MVVRLGPVPEVPSDPPTGGNLLSMTAGEARLYWPDVGAVRLRHGRAITLDPGGPSRLST